MRIGIVTFYESTDNYGEQLQCFALQRFLLSIGHNPFLIRYGFESTYFHWLKKRNFTSWKGVKLMFSHVISTLISPVDDPRGFKAFRKKNIKVSPRCYNNIYELRRNPPKADCYIVGSDQVWAQLLSIENNKTFFLDFGTPTIKRIAYAPSFAMSEYPVDLCDELRVQLAKFDALSVRERSGVQICQDLGYRVQLTLDPTLLLDSSDYCAIMSKPKETDYAFVYHVNIDNEVDFHWNSMQVLLGSSTNVIACYGNGVQNRNMNFLNGCRYVYPSIAEWLGFISSSKVVITSSFHAIVFSILMHKNFIAILQPESKFAGNDRIVTLLDNLGLSLKIYNDDLNFLDRLKTPIQWEDVDKKLCVLKNDSIKFLNDNLC